MDVISLINMKGGVGKTTLCHNLAGAYAQGGARVLVVDNDWQSNLSQGLLGRDVLSLPTSATIAAVYEGEAHPRAVIRPTAVPGLSLLPGSMAAERFNRPEPWREPWPLQVILREFLAEVEADYDVALIDCPPGRTLCSWAALTASAGAIVPVQPEDYGSQGVGPMLELLEAVRRGPHPGVELLGLVVSMVAKRAIHQVYEEALRAEYGAGVLATTLPEAPVFPEAVAHRLPVTHYKKNSAAAKAVRALAGEIRSRLARPAAEHPSAEAA